MTPTRALALAAAAGALVAGLTACDHGNNADCRTDPQLTPAEQATCQEAPPPEPVFLPGEGYGGGVPAPNSGGYYGGGSSGSGGSNAPAPYSSGSAPSGGTG